MPRRKGQMNLSNKTSQPNKSVCVRLTPTSYAVFEEMAELNHWSVAQSVRYCAEEYLGLQTNEVIMPRKAKLQRTKT